MLFRSVYVFRAYGSEQLVAQYNVDAIRSGKRGDPRIYGGDVVEIGAKYQWLVEVVTHGSTVPCGPIPARPPGVNR